MKHASIPITPQIKVELERLHAQNGHLDEDILIRASKAKRNPLHKLFFWDDEEHAAYLGRREIARQLIVRVTIEPHEAEELSCEVSVRKYHGTGDGGYADLGTVMGTAQLRERLLNQALAELESFQKRYATLSELAATFAEVEKVRASRPRRKKKARKKKAAARS